MSLEIKLLGLFFDHSTDSGLSSLSRRVWMRRITSALQDQTTSCCSAPLRSSFLTEGTKMDAGVNM